MDLREYLFKKKIKHEDFAKRVGTTRRTLFYIMAGTSNPKFSLIKKIVEATNGQVTYEDIKTSEDTEYDSESS